MTTPISPEVASLTAVKVVGAVSSDDIARMSQQLYYLTKWAEYLALVDWSQVKFLPGPATPTPTKPPPWP
jgi:hypothetical protein